MSGITAWSPTASANTSVGGINIAEGCPPGNVNDGIRQVMAILRSSISTTLDATLASGNIQASDATLTALANLTTAANQLIYATGPDAFAMATLTPFARTLLDDPDAATARATLGTFAISSFNLASPGYVKFPVGAGTFQVCWGTVTTAANALTVITYPSAFLTASFPTISGGLQDGGANENNPFVASSPAPSATGFSAFSSRDESSSCTWLAVGY